MCIGAYFIFKALLIIAILVLRWLPCRLTGLSAMPEAELEKAAA